MDLIKEWGEDQERALKIAGEIELELAIFVVNGRPGREARVKALWVMVLLLPSFWAISGHSWREDISLAILVSMFGTAIYLFVEGHKKIREVQKDLHVFLKKCAQSQDPNMQTALAIVIQGGNFPAWKKQIIEARSRNWESRMKQNPPTR